jgi:hypothetical protein
MLARLILMATLKGSPFRGMHPRVAAAVLCLVATSSQAGQRPLPDPQRFLQDVRAHLQTDDERQSSYVYVETRRDQKLDKAGRPTDESLKVFESYPALPGERRWNRLLAEDGRPVPPRELEQTDRERQKHAEEYARKLEKDPAKERAEQDRERERNRRERAESIDEIFRVFDVRMLAREALEGHETIVFSLTPRPGVKPRTRAGNIMRNFSGRAWISESDYELVRLDVEAIDTVSFGLGLLARLHKGSQVSFQRRKVNDEAWLPAVVTYSFSARVGLVAVFRRGVRSEFSNYKKFNVDTSTSYAPRKP